MSLLPFAAAAAVWTFVLAVRWRRVATARRVRRQWEQAVATLDALAVDRGAGPHAGQVWCRPVEHLPPPVPDAVQLIPVQPALAPEPAAPALVAAP